MVVGRHAAYGAAYGARLNTADPVRAPSSPPLLHALILCGSLLMAHACITCTVLLMLFSASFHKLKSVFLFRYSSYLL